ncbi:hypothetical protein Tco_1320508 [Tanacetum coccineum]
MTLSSTLIASENSLVCPLGSLVVVGSSRHGFTVTGQMANPFAVSALGSTWPIMVIVALGEQRFDSSVRFLLTRPNSISPCHIVSFEWLLLVLVVSRVSSNFLLFSA